MHRVEAYLNLLLASQNSSCQVYQSYSSMDQITLFCFQHPLFYIVWCINQELYIIFFDSFPLFKDSIFLKLMLIKIQDYCILLLRRYLPFFLMDLCSFFLSPNYLNNYHTMIQANLDFIFLHPSCHNVLLGIYHILLMILILVLDSYHFLNCFKIYLLNFVFLFPFQQDQDMYINLAHFYFSYFFICTNLNYFIHHFHIQISVIKDRIFPFLEAHIEKVFLLQLQEQSCLLLILIPLYLQYNLYTFL